MYRRIDIWRRTECIVLGLLLHECNFLSGTGIELWLLRALVDSHSSDPEFIAGCCPVFYCVDGAQCTKDLGPRKKKAPLLNKNILYIISQNILRKVCSEDIVSECSPCVHTCVYSPQNRQCIVRGQLARNGRSFCYFPLVSEWFRSVWTHSERGCLTKAQSNVSWSHAFTLVTALEAVCSKSQARKNVRIEFHNSSASVPCK